MTKILMLFFIIGFGGVTNLQAQENILSQQCQSQQFSDKVVCALTKTSALIDELFHYVPINEWSRVFYPIQMKSNLALDALNDLGPFSKETRTGIIEVADLLEKNELRILELLTTPINQSTARSLLSAIRIIKKELQP